MVQASPSYRRREVDRGVGAGLPCLPFHGRRGRSARRALDGGAPNLVLARFIAASVEKAVEGPARAGTASVKKATGELERARRAGGVVERGKAGSGKARWRGIKAGGRARARWRC